jgi:hypothetical protein
MIFAASTPAFDRALSVEIAASEQIRTRVLAGALAILFLGDQLLFLFARETIEQFARRLYKLPEISGHECAFDVRPPRSASYRGGRAGAQLTAQSERIRSWLVANRFHAISQASMMSVRLANTELASQWLRR